MAWLDKIGWHRLDKVDKNHVFYRWKKLENQYLLLAAFTLLWAVAIMVLAIFLAVVANSY